MSKQTITRVEGRAIPLRGDEIDTDRIMPARHLRCVTFEGLGAKVFEDDRAQSDNHPFDNERYAGATVLLTNKNFGCGSSREHAPQGLQRWGIGAIVAESFAEIFHGNCTSLGLPCLKLSAEDMAAAQQLVEDDPTLVVVVDVQAQTVTVGERTFTAEMKPGVRQSLLEGTWDTTDVLLEAGEAIDKTAARLPYVGGWQG